MITFLVSLCICCVVTRARRVSLIKLKDLVNRKYDHKRCIGFEIEIHKENLPDAKYLFKKLLECDKPTWEILVIMPRDRDKDTQVYNLSYEVPRDNIPLETIAGIGLRFFQLKIQEEIQQKSDLNFELSDVLQGMI